MTPNLAIVECSNPYWRSFRLWLPLFLLWIPLILIAPLLLLALLIACVAFDVSFWQSIQVYWSIFSSLSGTEVSVRVEENHIHIRLL